MTRKRTLHVALFAGLILACFLGLGIFWTPSFNNRISTPAPAPSRAADVKEAPKIARLTAGDDRTGQPSIEDDQRVPDEKARACFDAFHAWCMRYTRTDTPEARKELEAEGAKRAALRKGKMLSLMRSHPLAALQEALPQGQAASLPAVVRAHLAQHIEARGQYEFIHVCGQGADCKVERRVTIGARTYTAHVYGQREHMTSKDDIPLRGIALDGHLALWESSLRRLSRAEALNPSLPVANPGMKDPLTGQAAAKTCAAAIGGKVHYFANEKNIRIFEEKSADSEMRVGPREVVMGAPNPWTTGPKQILFIRVDFSDKAGDPISESSARDLIDNTCNTFYQNNSYGQTSMTATVIPTLRLPQTSSWYNSNGRDRLLNDATAAARAAGYEPNDHDRYIVGFKNIFSGWAGVASVGGRWLMLNGYFGLREAAHELGHTYGLIHGSFWSVSAQDDPMGPGTFVEYGDDWDTMGNSSGSQDKHFNVSFKKRLDWLSDAEAPLVSASGTYRIQAYDQPFSGSGLAGFQVLHPDKEVFWVGFRQLWSSNKWIHNGAVLHWGSSSQYGADKLLDMTPGSGNGKNDHPLVIGRTFSYRNAGIHITPTGKGGTSPESLDVVVNLGDFPANNAPSLSVTASTLTAAVGQFVNLTATASDPNGDTLAYYWDFGGGDFGSNSPNASRSWSSAGLKSVRCIVSDMKGGEAARTVVVAVGNPSTFRISGQVTWKGQPLQGVQVKIGGSYLIHTDADGTYVLADIPAGSHTVSATAFGYAITASGFSNPVTLGPDRTGVNFSASQLTYAISGSVHDLKSGLPGVTVAAGTISTTTDVNGDYVLSGLPNGFHTLSASKAGYEFDTSWIYPPSSSGVVEINGANQTGKLFRRRTYQVHGIVRGVPSNGPDVIVQTSGGEDSSSAYYNSEIGGWEYYLNGLPKGSYTLQALSTGYTLVPDNFTNPLNVDQNLTNRDFKTGGANTAPTIGNIAAQTINEDTASGAIAFSVGDAETPVANLTMSGNSNNAGLVPNGNIVFGGSGANRTVTLTPLANQSGVAQISISVSDGVLSASTSFNLTVSAVNDTPVINSPAWANPNPVVLPATSTAQVVASDPDGDTLTYTWSKVSGPGTPGFSPNGTAVSDMSTVAFNAAGTYELRVTAADGKGGSASSEVTVLVNGGGGNTGPGDLTGDGMVNIDDLVLVVGHFGQSAGDSNWDARADGNRDGVVNIMDLTLVTANFGKTY